MTKLTDERKREITEGLAEFMGWKHKPFDGGIVVYRGSKLFRFEPFTDLRDAHLLLVKCKERGLLVEIARVLFYGRDREVMRIEPPAESPWVEGVVNGLLSTAEQQTLAVWEVIEKLNKERKLP